ncbi:MAG: VWA domain-containing protein [Flavobacteriales bacterium]
MSTRGTYRIGSIATVVLAVEVAAWAVGLFFLYTADRYLQKFRWERPEMLWALLAGPALTALFLINLWMKNRAMKRFSSEPLLPYMVPGVSSWRTALRFLLLRHAFSFAVFALAGPQEGTRMEKVTTQGVDVVVALDVSNSMLAEDLRPNRMEVAKRALSQLIDRMDGDRLGIVVFAGQAFTQLPLTADRSAAKLFLGSIGPNMVSAQGTAIGAAVDLAHRSFPKDASTGRAIIVISDGESFEDDGEAAAKSAAEDGIVVNTIGLGSPQGSPIPDRRGGQVYGFKKDREGQTVMTKLNEQMLQRIAAAGKGEYVLANAGDTGVNALVAHLKNMGKSETGTYTFTGHEDRYAYFLVVACALVVLGLFIGERGGTSTRNSFIPWNA